MKNRLIAAAAGALLVAGSIFAAAPAHAVTTTVYTKAFPASSTSLNPPKGTGWYHNGKKTTVTVPKTKCASGVANQGWYYRYIHYASGASVNFRDGYIFRVCK